MIDIKPSLVTLLSTATGWSPYYEALYKPGTLPAVTYTEVDNRDLLHGTLLEYSTIEIQIKIWTASITELITKSIAIDTAMKAAGWIRSMSFETNDSTNTLIKVLRYVAVGYKEG